MSHSRKVLNLQSRELVLKLRKYFEKEFKNGGPLIPLSKVCKRTADALGICSNTVTKITKKELGPDGSSIMRMPIKKRIRKKTKTGMDSSQEDAIRLHVNDYYYRGDVPTVKKLLSSLADCGLFTGKKTSLKLVLKKLDIKLKISNKRKVSTEKEDLATHHIGMEFSKIVPTAEASLNVNHAITTHWTVNTPNCIVNAPSHVKGERIIVDPAGYIPNSYG